MNDLALRQNTELVTTNKNPFEQFAEAANPNKIVGDLIKFAKGEWVSGRNEKEVVVPIGTKFVANMDELLVGWVRWDDGKPNDMVMGKTADGYTKVRRGLLGDVDKSLWPIGDDGRARDPWQETNYLIMKEVNSDRLYTFAISSTGGKNAIGVLCGVHGKHLRQKPEDFPVVALGVDSYKHPNKAYGKIFVPTLDVVGWQDKAASVEALLADKAATKADDEAEVAELAAAMPERIVPKRENSYTLNPTAKAATAETRF